MELQAEQASFSRKSINCYIAHITQMAKLQRKVSDQNVEVKLLQKMNVKQNSH
jgi:hypothetical protein